jgi:hypothetical protein
MSRFEQVGKGINERLEEVSLPPRSNSNQLMSRFEQVESGINERLKMLVFLQDAILTS